MDRTTFHACAKRFALARWLGFTFAAALWLGPAAYADLAGQAWAAPPRVRFDVSYVVSCRDVTPPEFGVLNPGERLVEAAFHISTLLEGGSEAELAQLFFQIESPDKTLRIVDHLPRTELTSQYAGTIAVEKRRESGASIGVAAKPNLEVVSLSASAEATSKRGMHMKYELLPPQELLAASGTLDRERGVYFKLKPSPQTSLEGAHEFVCLLRVPAHWRGDVIHVHCRAEGIRRGLWRSLDSREVCGSGSFLVTLYLEGDEEARRAVGHLVRCEERMRKLLAENRTAVAEAMYASQVPGLAAWRSAIDSQPPSELMAWVLSGQRSEEELQRLPTPVVQTVKELRRAAALVRQMNGSLAQRQMVDAEHARPR